MLRLGRDSQGLIVWDEVGSSCPPLTGQQGVLGGTRPEHPETQLQAKTLTLSEPQFPHFQMKMPRRPGPTPQLGLSECWHRPEASPGWYNPLP